MSDVLRKISARLALLNQDDRDWLIEHLPTEVSAELRQYAGKFQALLETDDELQDTILREFSVSYRQALLKKSCLDFLVGQLSALDEEVGQRMNQQLPACLRNEFIDQYGWLWLVGDRYQPGSETSSYVRERIFHLMTINESLAEL